MTYPLRTPCGIGWQYFLFSPYSMMNENSQTRNKALYISVRDLSRSTASGFSPMQMEVWWCSWQIPWQTLPEWTRLSWLLYGVKQIKQLLNQHVSFINMTKQKTKTVPRQNPGAEPDCVPAPAPAARFCSAETNSNSTTIFILTVKLDSV